MATIGTLVVKLVATSDRFDKRMKAAEGALKKAGISARGLKTALLSVGAAGAGIAFVAKKVFDLGSTVAETQSKFETVFGEATKSVQAFVDDFGVLAGLSQSQAKDLIATTGAIAQGMGFAQAASAQFAEEIIRVSGDLASFNNLPTADVAFRIQAALTGERESMKRLGIVITEADVQATAFAQTGKTVASSLTQQEKAAATLTLITSKAGVAMGDLARTQDSAANQARQIRAVFVNIAEDFATKLLPSIAALLPAFRQAAEGAATLANKVAGFATTLFDFVGVTNAVFRAESKGLSALTGDVEALERKFNTLREAADRINATLGEQKGFFARARQAVRDMLPSFILQEEETDRLREELEGLNAVLIDTEKLLKAARAAAEPTKQPKGFEALIPPTAVMVKAASDFKLITERFDIQEIINSNEEALKKLNAEFLRTGEAIEFTTFTAHGLAGGFEVAEAATGLFGSGLGKVIAKTAELQAAVSRTEDSFAALFTGLLTGGISSFQEFANRIVNIWLEAVARLAAVKFFEFVLSTVASAAASPAPAGVVPSSAPPAGAAFSSALATAPFATPPAMVINQTINLTLAAVDGQSAAAFLRTQKGTIAELMGEAAQESPGFARMIRG